MNINLEYEGKHYNFDIKKDVKIDYLKELSSKLFKSDKTLLELICNNNKLDGKNENILIQDLIPKGKNSTVLTVQMSDDIRKDNINNTKIKKIINNKQSQDLKTNKDELDINKNKINNNIYKTNNNANNKINIEVNDNYNINKMFENKIFIANYIKKSNELFAMMKEFNDKVKETDNILNRKMKNYDIGIDNNIYYYELSLFEKRLIEFQKRQINYYKELIQILSENNDEQREINFDKFYNKILLNNFEFNDKNKEIKKKNNIFPNIVKKNSKSTKKVNNLYDSNDLNNILPTLKKDDNDYKNNLLLNYFEKNKNFEDNEILKTLDERKTSKHKNNIEKIKLKNIKLKKRDLKTDILNNDNFSDKEIKNQNKEINNKIKINRNINKKSSEKIIKK